MLNDAKKQARKVVKLQLNLVDPLDYSLYSSKARDNVRLLLTNERPKTVLSYKNISRWLEIDLSPLEIEYADIQFEYVSPSKDVPFPMKEYDVIFVPIYGFNESGYRLGHGGGWYDRLLISQPKALKVGVGLEAGLVEFATEPHDIPMDIIVTESRLETLRKRNHR